MRCRLPWAAAVIENIVARYEGADAVAAYGVPDPVTGDQVMATIAGTFDPAGFAAFLRAQPDLGTKTAPRFVRGLERMPVTATNKIHRAVPPGGGPVRRPGVVAAVGGGRVPAADSGKRRSRAITAMASQVRAFRGRGSPSSLCAARDSNPGPAD